jgi:methylated-DNA-[protein]-cysteine S-methyltransferase
MSPAMNKPDAAYGNTIMTAVRTPCGWIGVAATAQGISRIILPQKDKKAALQCLQSGMARKAHGRRVQAPSSGRLPDPSSGKNRQNDYLNKVVRLLQAYFASECIVFDLPIDTRCYTTFQKAVWKATSTIPFGETRSYAWIARAIQNPKSVRAVGQALGANPLPIIIPCHRVVSSSGALGGFGGGLLMKKKLLALETSGRQLQRAAT